MKIIFREVFIKEHFLLFTVSSILIVLFILAVIILGIKEIKKNAHK